MALSPWFEDFHRFNICPKRHRGFIYDPEDFWSIPRRSDNLMQWPSFYRQLNNLTLYDDAVKFDKDKFQVNMDVQQFAPEEICVKASGNTVIVEAKHEEKQDEHGFISRHFIRKYTIPEDHDTSKMESRLSSDGVLTITAPKMGQTIAKDARTILITQTGMPTKIQRSKSDIHGTEKSKL